MPGHSDAVELGKINWSDAELQTVTIDYEAVSLRVRDGSGLTRTLRAEGYIGYNLVGFWDEVVIERAEISPDHPGLTVCIESIRNRLGSLSLDTGSPARNQRRWSALVVSFSDGSKLEVFFAKLIVDSSQGS